MSLSLTAKKGTKETLGAETTFAKQFYGSAQSSELGTFVVNSWGKYNLQIILKKRIYNPPVPQTALSLLSLLEFCFTLRSRSLYFINIKYLFTLLRDASAFHSLTFTAAYTKFASPRLFAHFVKLRT